LIITVCYGTNRLPLRKDRDAFVILAHNCNIIILTLADKAYSNSLQHVSTH